MTSRPSPKSPHEIADLVDRIVRLADEVDHHHRELHRSGWERGRHGASGSPAVHDDGTPQGLADALFECRENPEDPADAERQALTARIRERLGDVAGQCHVAYQALQRARAAERAIEDLIDLAIPEGREDHRPRDVTRRELLAFHERKVRQLRTDLAAEERRRRREGESRSKRKRRR